jgi:hypothetical protein
MPLTTLYLDGLLGNVDAGIAMRLVAADIVPAAELVAAEYATVCDMGDRIELRSTPAGAEYMKMIDALTGS